MIAFGAIYVHDKDKKEVVKNTENNSLYTEMYETVEMDSCQWKVSVYIRGGPPVHLPNCKYCKQRKNE